MAVREIGVNLFKLQQIMHIGVRRASGFMTIGLKASESPEGVQSALEAGSGIWRYLPADVPLGDAETIRLAYRAWIIECGLRELDQHCAKFCDDAYEILVLTEHHGKPLTEGGVRRITKYKDLTSVTVKLSLLTKEFGIVVDMIDELDSMSKARNALSHNFGQVLPRHCNAAEGLVLTWRALDFFIDDQPLVIPMHVEAGPHEIEGRPARREKLVRLGNRVSLASNDLSEICWTYQEQTDRIAKSIEDHLRGLGIAIPVAPVA